MSRIIWIFSKITVIKNCSPKLIKFNLSYFLDIENNFDWIKLVHKNNFRKLQFLENFMPYLVKTVVSFLSFWKSDLRFSYSAASCLVEFSTSGFCLSSIFVIVSRVYEFRFKIYFQINPNKWVINWLTTMRNLEKNLEKHNCNKFY